MSYENWLNYLRSAEKQSIMGGQVRKVFYKFPDGQQMAEEYSLDTGIVQRRAWRKSKQLMGEVEWEAEIGDTVRPLNSLGAPSATGVGGVAENAETSSSIGDFTLRESLTAPLLTKRVTKKNIEWRIRNMPYPLEVYKVTADADKRAIVVRTTNKKYYKEIPVQELNRCGLVPEQQRITVHHQYNTLIITYAKPEKVCELEYQVLLMLQDVKTETGLEDIMQKLLTK